MKSTKSIILFALLSLLISNCGGGGGGSDGGGGSTPASYPVRITSPSDTGIFQTDQPTVTLQGSAFVPEGASCPALVGTLPSGYNVTCSRCYGQSANFYLNCFLQVHVIWETVAPLSLGANSITITATDAQGHTGQSTIVVTRVPDTTPPTVVSVSPINGATGVSVNTTVAVNFSEAMDPSTINSSTITIKDPGGNSVSSAVTYDSLSHSAQIKPSGVLASNMTYQLMVSTGVKDSLGGNPISTPFVSSFTTGLNPDKTPPVVQSVSPVAGTYCSSTSTTITAQFSEGLDPTTVNAQTFMLTGAGGQAVGGSVAYANATATFVPSVSLTAGQSYTATLTSGIKDLAGNALSLPYTWNFSTSTGRGVGTWVPTASNGVPFAREAHVAVWTGSEMIIAGGVAYDTEWGRSDYTDQYGRYNPVARTWKLGRNGLISYGGKAVWTGSRMIVWPGYAGKSYDPGSDTWTNIATAGQLSSRKGHSTVWTGTEMIIWGGQINYSTFYRDGARYNPASDSWTPVSNSGAPSARYGHAAVWTGSEMIVWGGYPIASDGARYNPATDTWTPLNSTGAPSPSDDLVALWTGNEMIVWGAYGPGGLYNPVTDSWRAMDSACALSGRNNTAAVWTGTRMIVWGGRTNVSYLADGAIYDPATNTWAQMSNTDTPSARYLHTAVWTGNEMIIWGGYMLNSGGQFTPP